MQRGTPYCWGSNDFGQLGDNTTTDRRRPSRVLDLTDATSIVTGENDTCAIQSATAFCWGYSGYGLFQNGGGAEYHRPTEVPNLVNVTAISTDTSTLCVASDGAAYCWGYLANQQVYRDQEKDTPVQGLTNVSAVTSSETCAIDNLTAYCWIGSDGEPFRVRGLDNVTAISASPNTTCAISYGAAYCWGSNTFGQLGDGTTTARHEPNRVPGLSNVTSISTSSDSVCAVSSGEAYCWGSNRHGQLGDGTTTDRHSPNRVPGLVNVTSISTDSTATAGSTSPSDNNATTCAVSDATAYCWGSNGYGELGDGSTTERHRPTSVQAP
ncbi:RCC1 domain-containing protein [Gordonia oleivorans]|uniref:RCC1 domain-containing protein n=1 Tax=Gordonia oleivorans TaxID=3156618 RepID=UPI003CCE27C1